MYPSSLLVTVALVASLPQALAQGGGGIPQCAQSCVGNSIQNAGCGPTDIKCICSNKNLINDLSCCVAGKCSPADQQGTVDYANRICKVGGITTLPQTASCSSTSAPATSSSKAPAPGGGGMMRPYVVPKDVSSEDAPVATVPGFGTSYLVTQTSGQGPTSPVALNPEPSSLSPSPDVATVPGFGTTFLITRPTGQASTSAIALNPAPSSSGAGGVASSSLSPSPSTTSPSTVTSTQADSISSSMYRNASMTMGSGMSQSSMTSGGMGGSSGGGSGGGSSGGSGGAPASTGRAATINRADIASGGILGAVIGLAGIFV